MNRKWLLAALGIALAVGVPAHASPLNVLWYTGGITLDASGDNYETAIGGPSGLAQASGWNVTFWSGVGSDAALPTGNYNVLVVASPEGLWGQATDASSKYIPTYSALDSVLGQTGGLNFDPSSNRIVVTGADADFHYLPSNNPGNVADGPTGFLQNMINWAGNSTSMGLVLLGQTGQGATDYGTADANLGFQGQYSSLNVQNSTLANSINISTNPSVPAALTTGLDSTGLSGWNNSTHYEFSSLTGQWVGVTTDGSGNYATIVSVPGAGNSNSVPEPASLTSLIGLSLIALVGLRRRQTSR